jgi:hypothetical protein
LIWLLTQVITPFATRVLTGDGAFQVRFIFYAGVQALAGVIFLLIIREIGRCGLTREDTPPRMLRQASAQTAILSAAFLVSIPISFWSEWAYACWAAIPIVSSVATRIARARGGRAR